MPEQDVRKGIRTLISGGMAYLDDESFKKLGDSWKNDAQRRGLPTSDDAQYLREYVKIYEGLLSQDTWKGEADRLLKELNEKFDGKINNSIKKVNFPGYQAAEDAGWFSSMIC